MQIKLCGWTVSTGKRKPQFYHKLLRHSTTYRGADLSTLTDFVHVPEPGKNTLIFVIDQGVQLGVDNVSRLHDDSIVQG
jgi:hypothetical protein